MARLPLVPKRSTVGGFALIAFILIAASTALFFSYAGRELAPAAQIRLEAVVAAVLLVLGGLAIFLFIRPGEGR